LVLATQRLDGITGRGISVQDGPDPLGPGSRRQPFASAACRD
jgi:hypothetical protein